MTPPLHTSGPSRLKAICSASAYRSGSAAAFAFFSCLQETEDARSSSHVYRDVDMQSTLTVASRQLHSSAGGQQCSWRPCSLQQGLGLAAVGTGSPGDVLDCSFDARTVAHKVGQQLRCEPRLLCTRSAKHGKAADDHDCMLFLFLHLFLLA
jgi:hypothetical protein